MAGLSETTRRLRARAVAFSGEAGMSLPQYLLLEGLRSGDAKPLGRADFDRARAFVRNLHSANLIAAPIAAP